MTTKLQRSVSRAGAGQNASAASTRASTPLSRPQTSLSGHSRLSAFYSVDGGDDDDDDDDDNDDDEDEMDVYYTRQGRKTTRYLASRSDQSFLDATELPQSPLPVAGGNGLFRKKSASAVAVEPQVDVAVSGRSTHQLAMRNLAPTPALASDRPPLSNRSSRSHVPAVPSPLNPASSSSSSVATSRKNSVSGKDAADQSRSRSRPRSSAIDDAVISRPTSSIPPPSSRPSSWRPETTEPDLGPSQKRWSQPKSIRDLGVDFNRYYPPSIMDVDMRSEYSPLASTRPNSGFSTPLLGKRASDSFHEMKRYSVLSTSEQSNSSKNLEENLHGVPECLDIPLSTKPSKSTDVPLCAGTEGSEKGGFFEYVDDRLGAAEHNLPLFADEKEDDDDMHLPMWDDDVRYKAKMRDRFTRENIVSTLGLCFVFAGLLCVFVVLPAISYTGIDLVDYTGNTPVDQVENAPRPWSWVNDEVQDLLTNSRTGLIDPDTPEDVYSKTGINGHALKLVFSDEFNENNRTFYPGDDPYWFGFDGWYSATQDLEWYDPDALNTGEGTLQIQMDSFENHNLQFRSGMLNSWNQLCFKGGVFEISVSLPGPAGVHGLWPGLWTMGNLGRPGYLATTDGTWPYTYDTCDSGITPNQSMTDGTSWLPGQRYPACTCEGEENPTPGVGRGAPEIDIAEVSADWSGQGLGVATQSYQVAPFDVWWQPNYEFMETPNYNVSFRNTWTGGPYQQAVSTTTMLNNDWYDGKTYQKFAYEYQPGDDADAYIAWTIADEEMMRLDARAVGPNGNVGQRLISQEPMSIILNLGISNSWTQIEWDQLKFPTTMRVDYVRWYQRRGQEMITCDPPGYETTEFIARHPRAYRNVNLTHWEDAGYAWPRNEYMHGCEAAAHQK